MSLEADALVDRRRLRRRVGLWRLVAFLAAIAAVFLVVDKVSDGRLVGGHGQHVARIKVEGLITDDRKQQKLFERAADDKNVRAIIISINSPGGTTTGSEALYLAIREAAAKKPVVAVLGTVAASGGYITAIAADHIVARGNSITGSIGVIFQWAQVREALDRLGVKFEEVKSSPLKAAPSPFAETPEAARVVMQEMVADSYRWFVELVAERRKFDGEEARRLGDGRVYTGRQALDAHLIDAIGGEDEAMRWLAETRKIDPKLKIFDWSKSSELEELGFFKGLATQLVRFIASAALGEAGIFGELDATRRLQLDGLLSVWHASPGKAD